MFVDGWAEMTDTLSHRRGGDLTALPERPTAGGWETRSLGGYRAPEWEITEEHAARWLIHQFESQLLQLTTAARFDPGPGPVSALQELFLLRLDLKCWLGLVKRPPLHLYLRHGRGDWGAIARLLRGEPDCLPGCDE